MKILLILVAALYPLSCSSSPYCYDAGKLTQLLYSNNGRTTIVKTDRGQYVVPAGVGGNIGDTVSICFFTSFEGYLVRRLWINGVAWGF